ncbi:MAG: 5'/3'-nucleotidase SurE [Zymomonas mobilis subsp. pomaceae]|uniref:5'-nucleotidase SurE n=1 Tax=Zymomonas mobilis subsp. pomaceae (strain ATCC 29192 / DSM 22645 / JCM 10191 / CCUG 17912 / NBRC 13757 / NCIMB 11200 / NRRL B-4491 / Barker I) TaxID=579138 RepID=F8EUH9_ZYMMT|nr:5'/3'-nucleotidase SurE [Zymomonas mobilis]AEI37195.1 stationary-phase survival protein SurE [Zymomonas mobilis subsp. pomaceae ATCC 29192]MDX5948565.1 5'/3'-nucleotidase SurE [Zymomonas mobilis subsp. pomaceae]GEB88371.1 5'-nucleotidase SurE [Zymomonas mobilis subsp. pomaceae]
MRILITNDDGIEAEGIKILEAIARKISDDVTIVAPDKERSGMAHSLTLSMPSRLYKHEEKRYSVSGTPSDSVVMGIKEIMKDNPPDLVLSGINHGANLAEDVTYSGTVSAAMEGAIAGIRSIGLSQVYSSDFQDGKLCFDASVEWGTTVVKKLIASPLPNRTFYNVNFPACTGEDVKGIKVIAQGHRDYGRLNIEQGIDPRGKLWYWVALGEAINKNNLNADLDLSSQNYVTVTPLVPNFTDFASLESLTDILEK